MNILFGSLIFLIFTAAQAQYVKNNPVAYYTVPVPLALRDYAIFPIQMNDSGYSTTTNTISFDLPLRLTGEPVITVNLSRTAENPTLWQGKDFTSICSETKDGEFFNCQLYLLNKKLIDKNNLKKYLQKKTTITYHGNTFTEVDIDNQLAVLDRFLTSEPAGTLVQKINNSESQP